MGPVAERGHPRAIGRYRVDGLLGRGAMGMVYLARDLAIERDVAIKTIHRALLERTDAEAWVARFQAEVRAAGRCLHPNIVTVFEYGEHDEVPYLVMELVEGRELRDYTKGKGPMSPKNALLVVTQVLRALEHAHAHGVVHRDIKPANVIVLPDGQVKVTDFGIARLDHAELPDERTWAMGTPGYMAPEQLVTRDVDGRADLYSAGVVLFELLAGQRPFHKREDRDLPHQVLHDPPPRVSALNPAVPPSFNPILERALAKYPDQRFQSASSFLEALERLALPAAWDGEKLAALERVLVEEVGPLARVLVRRAAERAPDASALVEPLAAAIPEPGARARFLERAQAIVGPLGSVVSATSSSAKENSLMAWALGPFARETLEVARQELAVHLGPIARVLVKRAAATSRTVRELYQHLATHLEHEEDRRAFLERTPEEEG